MTGLKKQLYDLCLTYLKTREAEIKTIIAEAQDAANSDTKSSAGDKFETGRELMQQEIDINTTRLAEVMQQKKALERINPEQPNLVAAAGALVVTNNGNYYIATGAGKLTLNGNTYFAISAASPIGLKLHGLHKGDEFSFNNKSYTLKEVC